MTEGVRNEAMFGIRNENFEKAGAKPADRYAGEDGLVARVARAAKIAIIAAEKGSDEQKERAATLLRERVSSLFEEFQGDARAIAGATAIKLGDMQFSYNTMHISVPNPNHVPPVATTRQLPDGGYLTTFDWSRATHDPKYFDVTPDQILANPILGTQLIVRTQFQL
jgi:hypothetical protein